MGLNKSKGNMYEWVTHTYNTIKGACYHDCSYCYMKRWGKLNPVRLDKKELKTDLGEDNFIFVGSSCDMWCDNINTKWIIATLLHCEKFDNHYLFQSKNPKAFNDYAVSLCGLDNFSLCTTIETNRIIPEIMGFSPHPQSRSYNFAIIPYINKYITIEPIMDFDLSEFLKMIKSCQPIQVNIGADSGGNNLPEPPKEKILELITELEKFTVVKQKKNLNRIVN